MGYDNDSPIHTLSLACSLFLSQVLDDSKEFLSKAEKLAAVGRED